MAKDTPERKPRGFGKFSELMKKLVQVPKEQVDAQIAASKPKRRKKK